MSTVRIALANIEFPATPEESVRLAEHAIAQASTARADLICFPECFVPGYRGLGKHVPPPDPAFLERAWSVVAAAARKGSVAVILGTERTSGNALLASALVINRDGTLAGLQDKVQLDPSEDETYSAGAGRRVFQAGPLTFGVVICHEGFRYPETVRWAVRHGAQVVFHPHFDIAEPGGYQPSTFADPANTFHEKAALCRAAENTCFFATVNCASPGSPTTSAFVRPDGTLLSYQPYGQRGLLIADLDLAEATGLLAARCKSFQSRARYTRSSRLGGLMAKRKIKGNAKVDRAAEAVGHTLGTIAGTIESLQAQHPHPVEEARKVLSKTATRATAIVKKAKTVARRSKKVAMEKVVKPARKAVASGRKNVARTARRLKR